MSGRFLSDLDAMPAYYNEFDPHAAAWLRELIRRGLIAAGDVDERSITEVHADDLRGYDQCHFFAGIGGWSYALRLAGIGDDRPVWTGSCPCQPFSTAGRQRGHEDERHLWPAFFHLIRKCRPAIVFGEQVAGSAGYAWWDHVAADLEGEGYAAAAADIGAHSVGAPHIRQRLYWVGYSNEREWRSRRTASRQKNRSQSEFAGSSAFGRMGDADSARLEGRRDEPRERAGERAAWPSSPWCDPEWLQCTDGTARPAQRGLFPVADGLPEGLVRGGDRSMAPDADASAEARVMRLRGYGNAIVPQVAARFIQAML